MAAGVAEKLHFCIKAIKKRIGESKCFVGFKINSKPRHGDSCFGPLKPCGLRCQSDAQLASGRSRSITGTKKQSPIQCGCRARDSCGTISAPCSTSDQHWLSSLCHREKHITSVGWHKYKSLYQETHSFIISLI